MACKLSGDTSTSVPRGLLFIRLLFSLILVLFSEMDSQALSGLSGLGAICFRVLNVPNFPFPVKRYEKEQLLACDQSCVANTIRMGRFLILHANP